MASDLVQRKQQLRLAVRRSRANRAPAARVNAAAQLTEQLITVVRGLGARTVSCYVSMPNEPDTSEFCAWAQRNEIEVLVPVSHADHTLSWVRWNGDAMAPGLHGIAEPLGERLGAAALVACDVVLVPACAADERGGRLGWGKGYYDRCLAALPETTPVLAVVFDDDVVDAVPMAAHDARVSGVVTERRIIWAPGHAPA